jgi:hypothetical protein
MKLFPTPIVNLNALGEGSKQWNWIVMNAEGTGIGLKARCLMRGDMGIASGTNWKHFILAAILSSLN